MRKDLTAWLELERRTKAKKIAPLVHDSGSASLLWHPHACLAWCRRRKIVLAQLQLRADTGLAPDEKAVPVASVCQQYYEEDAKLPERGKLFGFLRSDDALSTVLEFVEEDSINGFGAAQFLYRCETQFGKLTDEETAGIAKMETVGEFAELLAKAAAEGREKGEPFSESRGMRLLGRIVLAIFLCCLSYLAYSVIAWLVRRILAYG
jgi:hypothetical protein